VLALVAALSIAVSATARLDVPYVPQSPSLCGGAAAAMVFRYWGDSHADVEPFAALVDRAAGGIATDRLVGAIRDRRWNAMPFTGTEQTLRDQLAAHHPIILLIEDHPNAYHYVVAVGADKDDIFVHDPSWGPSRRFKRTELARAWGGANFWALLVLPSAIMPSHTLQAAPAAVDAPTTAVTRCDELLRAAVEEIGQKGLDSAETALTQVHNACPSSAAPIAELAGVRFAQRRWRDAADLAQTASETDPANTYAWDVLGSSRYMLDDLHGALAAWNHIGKPKIDAISITGLRRTRYQIVAEAIALKPNTLLTVEDLRLAERRLEQLPDQSHTRVSFVRNNEGYATVDIAVAEQGTLPHNVGGFAAVAANGAINREVTLTVPGTEGQGEIWSGTWRWWENRPRVAFEFAGPRVGFLPGTWRVNASWEAQTFATDVDGPHLRERQVHAGVTMTNWLTHAWRYEVAAGADSWDSQRRDMSLGATIETRNSQDRIIASATLEHWFPLVDAEPFSRALLMGSFRSKVENYGLVDTADVGFETVTSNAPMSLWPGAGEGHARAPLLRAHPLLIEGIVTGPVFGRHVEFGTNELTYWATPFGITRVGFAVFADSANASARMKGALGYAFHVDAGAGLRVRVPGGTLRVDYARGLRDDRDAVTIGFNWFQ